jgi:NAD(P)H-nitrite reductase large subunit
MATRNVILGSGPVGTNAVETIRQLDGGSSCITLLGDEAAHSRMALPYWLSGQIPREHVLTGDDAYFRKLGVTVRSDVRATAVDPTQRLLTLSDGSKLQFDNLLIGTGASPVIPAIAGSDLPGVTPLWSLAHTQRVLDAAQGLSRPRVVLVGAGFIGFIVLGAMFKRGWSLTVVEREPRVLPRMLDEPAARIVQRWLASRGVQVHCGTTVTAIRPAGTAGSHAGEKIVELADGTQLPADIVILAVGIRPNIDFLQGSGIELDEGILINDRCQTNFPFIYAGGDVAQGPVLFRNQRAIHAIQPTAVDHGRVAGANMAGHEVQYPGSLAMNVVDVCGLQTCSFGEWSDPSAEAMTIDNAQDYIYRKLLWRGDQMVGAIFTGRANDLGMLNDVGMVKGILQTQVRLGTWKEFLRTHPFDIRRAYIGAGVAAKLSESTLLGRPAQPRQYRFQQTPLPPATSAAHELFLKTRR